MSDCKTESLFVQMQEEALQDDKNHECWFIAEFHAKLEPILVLI